MKRSFFSMLPLAAFFTSVPTARSEGDGFVAKEDKDKKFPSEDRRASQRTMCRFIFRFSLFICLIFSGESFATCRDLFRPADTSLLSNAILEGRHLLEKPSTVIRDNLYLHETSTEVLEMALLNNGFAGGRVIDYIDIKSLWSQHAERRVIFLQPTRELLRTPTVERVMKEAAYANISSTSHYLWSKLDLTFEEGVLLRYCFIGDRCEPPPGWARLVSATRARNADPKLAELVNRLNTKFGSQQIQKWLREARARGGIVIIFKNTVEKISTFRQSKLVFDAKPLLLDEPLSVDHIWAILPTNDAAAQRLEKLELKYR